MERLIIKNFLCIEEADFEVGRFNIIIGSQASGKSVIAKLLYCFRRLANRPYNPINNTTLEKTSLALFEHYFPKYSWERQGFEIYYQDSNFEIKFKNNNTDLIIEFSKDLLDLDLYLQREFECEFLEKNSLSNFYNENEYYKFREIAYERYKRFLFIPASRAFFAHIQKNIFSLLNNNLEIDIFIQEFGSEYERRKLFYSHNKDKLNIKMNSLIETILIGKYTYELEQDWIETKGKKINLLNSSSGQQEALPMLVMLTEWIKKNEMPKIFIEEPEAHLFPISQKHVISLLGIMYNQFQSEFVITTHSPYILTAVNNAILAHDVIEEKGIDAVKDIFDPDFAIKYEDVKAYTIEDGYLISIMDDETRLIGTTIIDSVSDEFETVFDNLFDLQG